MTYASFFIIVKKPYFHSDNFQEDDAFQLASFLESIDQINNVPQNVATENLTTTNEPQQQCNERSWNCSNPIIPAMTAMTTETDSNQPLDLSIKQTTPMSTDTGFNSTPSNACYLSPNEVQIGVSKNRNYNDTTIYSEYRKNSQAHDNTIDRNSNYTGNSFKPNESVDKRSLNTLSRASLASNVPCDS